MRFGYSLSKQVRKFGDVFYPEPQFDHVSDPSAVWPGRLAEGYVSAVMPKTSPNNRNGPAPFGRASRRPRHRARAAIHDSPPTEGTSAHGCSSPLYSSG